MIIVTIQRHCIDLDFQYEGIVCVSMILTKDVFAGTSYKTHLKYITKCVKDILYPEQIMANLFTHRNALCFTLQASPYL